MSLISFSPLADGVTAVNAAATNTPLSTIYNDYNGNITAANLATNAVTTAKITAANVTAATMQYGMIRQRQGGTTGDGSWLTAGTSNTDTSAKAAFWQVGAVTSPSATTKTVTFPVAFTQIPLVICTMQSAVGANQVRLYVRDATTTQFTLGCLDAGTEICGWVAIGQ